MRETTTQKWQVDASDTNAVTFQEQGSISVTEANPDRVIAANVAFDDTPSDDANQNSLLTVNFNNAPSVSDAVIGLPASDNTSTVHIYASSEGGVPAIGIHLEEAVNLAIDTTASHRPTIAAYANVSSDTANASVSSAAIIISAANTNRIELNDNSSLFSSSTTTSFYSYPYPPSRSASSVIGAAIGNGNATTNNLTATFGSDTILTSSSFSSAPFSSYSASSVIGAAVGNRNATPNNLTATFGSDNILTPSTSSSYSSASSVIGLAIGSSNGSVEVNTLTAMLGNDNTLTFSGSSSASSVIGAAVWKGNAATNDLTATLGDKNTLTSSSSSASSVIGAAAGYGSVTSVNNLTAMLGNNNTLTSFPFSSFSSSYYSASRVTGAAVGSLSGLVEVNTLTAMLGNSKTLISSSSSPYSSASSVIGASVGYGSATTVNNLTATLGDGNTLISSSFSSSYSPASSVIGAAVGYGTGTANAVTVNMNGSQTLSAMAYAENLSSMKGNTFGADNTDKGDSDFGWRVRVFTEGEDVKESAAEDAKTIFYAVAGNSPVSILSAKLSSSWDTVSEEGKATATLGGDQASSRDNYARAFALGNDFKIYVGGRANAGGDGFTPVSLAEGTSGIINTGGTTNVVKIIGAISKGKDSTGTAGSSLTVDSG
jgi:hypothetical protein